jgi:hypothetical protein
MMTTIPHRVLWCYGEYQTLGGISALVRRRLLLLLVAVVAATAAAAAAGGCCGGNGGYYENSTHFIRLTLSKVETPPLAVLHNTSENTVGKNHY